MVTSEYNGGTLTVDYAHDVSEFHVLCAVISICGTFFSLFYQISRYSQIQHLQMPTLFCTFLANRAYFSCNFIATSLVKVTAYKSDVDYKIPKPISNAKFSLSKIRRCNYCQSPTFALYFLLKFAATSPTVSGTSTVFCRNTNWTCLSVSTIRAAATSNFPTVLPTRTCEAAFRMAPAWHSHLKTWWFERHLVLPGNIWRKCGCCGQFEKRERKKLDNFCFYWSFCTLFCWNN